MSNTIQHFVSRILTPKTKRKTSLGIVFGVSLFLSLLCSVSTIKCFHCLESPKSNETHLSCFHFDRSPKFHKHCEYSTFCMKKSSQYRLQNGSFIFISIHRCADQAHRTMVQDPKTGDWSWARLTRTDLYNEGCFQHSIRGMLTTESVHCYCKEDLCNSAPNPITHRSASFAMVVILHFVSSLFLHGGLIR